jgi:hypothetical protein
MSSVSNAPFRAPDASKALVGYLLRYADFALLAALPVVLLAFNRSWTFLTPARQIDPYIYTGFFLDFPHLLQVAPPSYYGSRIPWLLVGGGAYNLLGPDAGNIALRLLLFWAGAGLLYGVVRLLFDSRRGALVAAFALGVNPFFLAAVAWDYPNGPAIALLLLTLLGLALAWRRDPRWLALAGFAALTGASVQLVTVPLLVAILLPFAGFTRWFRAWVWLALGALAALLLFGLVNLYLVGAFDYWRLQLVAAAANQGNQRRDYISWIQHARWLVPHVIGLAAAAALAVRRTPIEMMVAAWMFLAALAFLYFEFGDMSKANVLGLDYYAVMLTPLSFVAIGGALSRVTPRAAGAACVVLIAPFALGRMNAFPLLPCCESGPLMGLAAAVAAGLTALAIARPRFALPAVVALTFNYAAGYPFPYVRPLEQDRLEARMIIDTVKALRPYNEDGRLAFWYDIKQPLGDVYRGVSSSNRWSAISEAFPKLIGPYNGEPANLYPGLTFALLTTDMRDFDLALQIVDAWPLTSRELGRLKVGDMNIYVVKVDPWRDSHTPCANAALKAAVAGGQVRLEATATCGGIASFVWMVDEGGKLKTLTPYTTDAVLSYQPPRPGVYEFMVWVQNQGGPKNTYQTATRLTVQVR